MNSGLTTSGGAGLPPNASIQIYHPDSRAIHDIPLRVLTERIERALHVRVHENWLPTLVGMADGLFMQVEAIKKSVARVSAANALDSRRALRQVPDVLEQLSSAHIIEKQTIEQLYRNERLEELNHPRVWEINDWWEGLYGVIPAKSEWDDEEDLDIWADGGAGLNVGRTALPIGMEPERDEVRILLEKKVITQYEFLYRLRLSWHR